MVQKTGGDMEIKTTNKAKMVTEGFFKDGKLKTHDCEIGGWHGETVCERIDFDDVISQLGIMDGEYKVTVVLEKIE